MSHVDNTTADFAAEEIKEQKNIAEATLVDVLQDTDGGATPSEYETKKEPELASQIGETEADSEIRGKHNEEAASGDEDGVEESAEHMDNKELSAEDDEADNVKKRTSVNIWGGKVGRPFERSTNFVEMNNPLAFEQPLPNAQFADHLKCSLCLDLLRKPVMAAVSCGHHFCETEIKTALLQNKKCPICRATVKELMRDHFAESTVEIYYAQNPNVARRPDCELWTGRDPFAPAETNRVVVDGLSVRISDTTVNILDHINAYIEREEQLLNEALKTNRNASPAPSPPALEHRQPTPIHTISQVTVRNSRRQNARRSTGGSTRQHVVPTARVPVRLTPAPPCPTRRRRRGPATGQINTFAASRTNLRFPLSPVRRDANGRQISRSGRRITAPTPFQA